MRINNHSVETSNNAGIKAGESQTENSGRVNINHLMSKVRNLLRTL